MISNGQLKALLICEKGTLLSTVNNVLYSGNRPSGGSFEISEQELVGDYMGRENRNKIGIKAEMSSFQWQVPEIVKLINFAKVNKGADVQVITELETGQTQSPYGGIYNLSGDNFAGIDFEIVRSNKEAYVKLIAEAWYDYTVGQSVIAAAATNAGNATLLATTGGAGIDFSKMIRPNVANFKLGGSLPNYSPIAAMEEIKEWSLTVKTDGEKSQYGRTIPNVLNVNIEATLYDASISKINALLNESQTARIGIDVLTQGGGWESWTFNLLAFNITMTNEDRARTVKLVAKGDVFLGDITSDLGGPGKVINFN